MEEIVKYGTRIEMPVLLGDTVEIMIKNLSPADQNIFVFQLIKRLKELREAERSGLEARQREIQKSLDTLPNFPTND